MLKFLTAMVCVVALSAMADPISVTRKGYIELVRDGEVLSRHTEDKDAYEAAMRDAFLRAMDGNSRSTYLLRRPDHEVVVSFPEWVWAADEPGIKVASRRTPVPTDMSAVYVCRKGYRGGSFEPEGDDANSGMTMWNAVRTLQRANELAVSWGPGTDIVACEGGVWDDVQWQIDVEGLPDDPVRITYYVNIDETAVWGDRRQLCGAIGEPECPPELLAD